MKKPKQTKEEYRIKQRRDTKAPHRKAHMLNYRRAAWGRGLANAMRVAHRARAKNLIPKWADLDKIKLLYIEAALISERTGVLMHVDHIVPLGSKVVTGLHCMDNLRIVTKRENISKGNKIKEELIKNDPVKNPTIE